MPGAGEGAWDGTPRTWVAGDPINETKLNTEIRDRFQYLHDLFSGLNSDPVTFLGTLTATGSGSSSPRTMIFEGGMQVKDKSNPTLNGIDIFPVYDDSAASTGYTGTISFDSKVGSLIEVTVGMDNLYDYLHIDCNNATHDAQFSCQNIGFVFSDTQAQYSNEPGVLYIENGTTVPAYGDAMVYDGGYLFASGGSIYWYGRNQAVELYKSD